MKLWKKVLSAATAGALCLGSVGLFGMQSILEDMGTVLSVSAYDKVYKNLRYTVTDTGEIQISGCNNFAISVEIPTQIDGKPVTSIGNRAFEYCGDLAEITIPDSVTSIGIDAFNGTYWLMKKQAEDPLVIVNHILIDGTTYTGTAIVIPNDVISIVGGAFVNCRSLNKITIPNGVTSVEDNTFTGCSSLTEITIPDSVTNIGECAFYGCSSLTEITIPDSVTNIGKGAFSDTPWLKARRAEDPLVIVNHILIDGHTCTGAVLIPSSVTSIGDNAFSRCSSLTEITIPDSVTNIGKDAFSYCSGLTEITIPDSVTSIGEGAFSDTPWLKAKRAEDPLVIVNHILIDGTTYTGTAIVIPNDVISIVGGAFYGCSSLTEITIPDSVTNIGECAFYGCSSLTEITIPDSVTNIGECAFYGCSSLTEITIPDSVTNIGKCAFYGCSSLTEITIPDSVTNIGGSAFCYCRGLIEITIPDSVTWIGLAAFYNCDNLTIYSYTDSYAQQYATENNIPFIALDKPTTTTTTEETTTTTTETTTATTETTTTISSGEASETIYGDINLDGRIDITDAVLLNKFCSGAVALGDDARKNADCNGDGESDSSDAIVLLQFLVRVVNDLPYSG